MINLNEVCEQLTVEDLFEMCKHEIQKGNGNKHIVISDDNEGNGYHGMFYGFTPCIKEFKDYIYDSNFSSEKDTIILGNRRKQNDLHTRIY